jgi:hypothetical protein
VAKVKYDVTDVEVRDGDFVQPQPGLYPVKIIEANRRDSDGKNDIEVIVELEGKEFAGARLWSYVNFGEASRWKVREFTDALGMPPKGEIDTAKLVGKKCQVKVSAGTYEGEYRARLQRWLPLSDSADASDDEEDYSKWELDDLKAEVEERELTISGRATKAKLVEALQTHDELGGSVKSSDDDEDDEDDEPAGTSDEGEDYSEWELDELKSEAEDRGILGNIPGRKTKEKLIAALEADDAGPDDEDDEPASENEDDYDEWSEDELTSEVKDRELEVKGRKTKEKMIEALRKDDNTEAF